jgi:hypothetical protein
MTQTENDAPVTVYPSDVNKIVRACIKKQWPKWSAKQYSLKQDQHGNWNSYFTWFDHVDRQTMIELLKPFSATSGLTTPPITFEWDGKTYQSRTVLSYKRVYTAPFLTRIATIFCRRHQVPLPEIVDYPKGAWVRAEQNEPDVEGKPLSKAIIEFAHTIDAAHLDRLEQETEAQYPPLPQLPSAQQQQRDEAEAERHRAFCLGLEQQRQKYQFRAAIYQQLPSTQQLYAEIQNKLYELSKLIRKQAPDLYEPVFCVGCHTYQEEPGCTVIERPHFAITMHLCQACVEGGKYAPYPLPENVLKEEAELEALEAEETDEDFQPILDQSTGLYLGKNGEPMPVLTRDLLHDVRVSKWWLWFGEDTPEKKVPSQEVRDALRKEGWRWGYRRRQYHCSNPFGVLKIPEIVYQQYGGYVDGGFCDYRSTRGARLRAYAESVEGKADQMETWSNAIVATYMATGSIVTGGRRTRKLRKEKMRAEKKAAEARRLDAYAYDLRRRANSSEAYQQYLASDEMLPRRLDTLHADLRSYNKGFHDTIDYAVDGLHFRQSISQHSVRWLVHRYYDYYQPRKDIIQEEIDLIEATVKARSAGLEVEPEAPSPVPVPEPKERSFEVGGVIEVNVGADNRSDLFPTDKKITRFMLKKYPIPWDSTVLEPHGGTGAMLGVIREHLEGSTVPIYTYEWLWDLNQHLQQQGYTVLGSDYLESTLPEEIEQAGGYGDICSNPPFKNWEKQVTKAWEQLRPGGRIRVILPADAFHVSPLLARLSTEASAFEQTDLPEDAFKMSGTAVHTILVYMVKSAVRGSGVQVVETHQKPFAEEEGSLEDLPETNTCSIALPMSEVNDEAGLSEDGRENSVPSPAPAIVAPPVVITSQREELRAQDVEGGEIKAEGSASRDSSSTLLAQEVPPLAANPLGTLSTFGLQVSGSEAQVAAFKELWKGIAGRKALFDLRKIPSSKTKKAKALPAAWQHAFLQDIYGGGYFHRTKFKHDARLIRSDGQPPADPSSEVWEVDLLEGPIEELLRMLKWGYSLVLLDDDAAYNGSLRHAIVEALRKRFPDLVIGTLS